METDELYHKRFGQSAFYFAIIDSIINRLKNHKYQFISNELLSDAAKSKEISASHINCILTAEILDKAHLASLASLVRTKRWGDALILMEKGNNYLGWAASLRGLIESAGDSLDRLRNVGGTLAANRSIITQALSGRLDDKFPDFSEVEGWLDHFIHAGWRKPSDKILTAKANVFYVRFLEEEIPGVVQLYHKLCAISHPSKASFDYFYRIDSSEQGGLYLNADADADAISSVIDEFPAAIPGAMMMACNPALINLKVLHKFKRHPNLEN